MTNKVLILGAAAALFSAQAGASERIPVNFVIENFSWLTDNRSDFVNRLSWIEGRAQLSPESRLVGSFLDVPKADSVARYLDELFVEWAPGAAVLRIGRMRPRFGFGDWSELFYTPIARAPICRTNPVNSGFSLLRQGSGIDAQAFFGNVEIQAGVFESRLDGWQIAPRRLDQAAVRTQVTASNLMLGANLYTRLDGNKSQGHVAGIDLRWSQPHWQVRGEYVKGIAEGQNAEGGYLDVYFRPEGFHRTQFGARAETFDPLSGPKSQLWTLGVRHMFTKNFVGTLNYGWGSRKGPSSAMRGWTIQLMSAFSF